MFLYVVHGVVKFGFYPNFSFSHHFCYRIISILLLLSLFVLYVSLIPAAVYCNNALVHCDMTSGFMTSQ